MARCASMPLSWSGEKCRASGLARGTIRLCSLYKHRSMRKQEAARYSRVCLHRQDVMFHLHVDQ